MKHVAQPHLCGALTGMIRLMMRLVPMVAVSAVLVGAASAQHVITTTPGAGGSIFPAGPITVPDGSKPIFFVIPNTGFSIQDVKVNNVSVGKDPQVHPGPVTAPVTITAAFIKSPNINATAAGSGTIIPSGNDFVGYGGSRTFQMQAGLASMLNALTVNGTPVVLPTPKPSQFSHTVSNITSNTTVKATFVADPNKVILTSTAGSGGTISPAGKVEATKGSSRSYTVTPLTGYYIADVKVDGKSVGKTGFPTLNNIQKNQTIVATFAKNPEIVATQSNGGSITPTGKSSVSYGGSRTYTITPLTGYEISHLMVNGKSQPASTSYTFFNVIANGTITAVFRALSTHVFVTSSAGAGGAITPLGKIGVAKGGSQSYTITPAAGFRIQDVKVDGKSVGAVSFHTLTNVQKPQTIAASFIKNPVITAKQSPGGSISPAGNTSVALNGSQGYTITPATGFDLIHLLIDGKVVTDTDGSYTFANVTKNATIGALFKQRTDHVALITSAGKGGTVTPAGRTLVQKGSNPEVTITPAANQRVLNVKVGNNSLGSVMTTTITNIQADTTVAATFTPLPVITAKQAIGGTILPAGSKVVPFEGEQTYSISPSLGYKLDNLIIDGKAVADTDGSYTFNNVTANHSISAKFSLTTHVVTASSPPAGTISPSGTLNILHGKDQSFTITPPASFKAGIRVNGVLKAQRPAGGPLTYLLKNIRRNYQVEAVFAPIGTQFSGTLGIAPIGLGDTINVANKTPATFSLITNGTLGVAGVYFHNATATKWGQASPTALDDNWTANVPLLPGDNEVWFAAVGTGGEVAWYPTIVTYYSGADFTTPLTPYVGTTPLSTLTVGAPTVVTWKIGLLQHEGAAVTLYQVGENDALTQVVSLTDDGTLPDEIEGDGIFTGNATITASSSGYLYYRAGVQKPGPLTYYSETKEVWAPAPLTDEQVNTAGETADDIATAYEALITGGDTPQEAAAAIVEQLKQDPDIGAAGSTEEGGVWWITEDGILGLYHPELEGQKAGEGSIAGGRGSPPPITSLEQASSPAQSPFYSAPDLATLFTQSALNEGSGHFPGLPPPAPPLSSDGKNRIKSDRAIIISPFINNPNGGNFGNNDDYYKPWPTIQANKSCGLYAAREVLNNGAVTVTLNDFKNLSGYGYIHISTHGDNYYNGLLSLWEDTWGPNDFLKGNLSVVGLNSGIQLFKVDGKYVVGTYADDLNAKRLAIGKSGKLYMLPKFFKDYLSTLPNSLVILSACRSGYNGSLMSVFLSKGAGTVIGYTDYVATSYTRNTLQEIVDRMYEDKTSLEAMQSAVTKYGSDDADSDPAALVYMGATDLYFPNSDLANGGFEDGVLDPWERAGDGRVITGLGATNPTEGKFMGIISTGLGYTTSSGSIQQRMCVPDKGGVLSFRWNMYSEEWLEYVGSVYQDAFSVSVAVVDPTTGAVGAFTPLFGETVDSLAGGVSPADVGFDRGGVYKTGWRTSLLNLNTYAGKTLVLKFSCTDVGDSIYDSAILLDDIKFMPGATPPP